MQELFFRVVFVVLMFIAMHGRRRFVHKVMGVKGSLFVKKKREMFLVVLSSPLMIIPFVYLLTNWLDAYNLNLSFELRLIGVFLFGFAVFLHNWTHLELNLNWSPFLEIKKTQELITTGPYKHVRHPMYSAFFLWAFAQGILLSNWVVLIIGVLCIAILYFVRVGDEEKMMLKHFGKKYSNYIKRTGSLLPKF